MIKKGALNLNEGFLGVPGTGKSYAAVRRLDDVRKRLNCYALVHDPSRSVPAGGIEGVVYHPSIQDAENQLRSSPGGIHFIGCMNADDVLRLAKKIAAKSFEANKGEFGNPCLVMIDEMVSLADSSQYRLGPELKEALARRRWLNIGMIWTVQHPQLIHYGAIALPTRLHLFRILDQRAHASLERIGVPPEITARLRSLPDRQSIEYVPGKSFPQELRKGEPFKNP